MATASVTAPAKASPEDFRVTNLFDVNNFKVVVTGAGTGIGLMIVQALANNGATVYAIGRREEALEKIAEKYGQNISGKIIPMPCDITSNDDITNLAKELAIKEPSGIQVLVNNAGIAADDTTKFSNSQPDMSNAEELSKHLLKSNPDDWLKTFRTNVVAHYFVSAALLPHLAKGTEHMKGYSSGIINVTSISGFMKGSSGGQFAYSTSKAAANQLTRNLATTFKDVKVRVNAIAPGVFPSEMTAGDSDGDNKSKLEGSGKATPAQRTGSETDMAAAVLFLAGPASTFLNCQFVHPDGGNMLVQPAVMG